MAEKEAQRKKQSPSEYVVPTDVCYVGPDYSYRAPEGMVIKRWQVKMSYEEKYRFGMLTVPEYYAWMEELANAQNEASKVTDDERFWESDTKERKNISSNDYDEFLKENSVDVSNSNTLDFDKLASQVNSEASNEATPIANDEPDMDAILKQVNSDIHGGNTVLSEEEIAALFAAAGN